MSNKGINNKLINFSYHLRQCVFRLSACCWCLLSSSFFPSLAHSLSLPTSSSWFLSDTSQIARHKFHLTHFSHRKWSWVGFSGVSLKISSFLCSIFLLVFYLSFFFLIRSLAEKGYRKSREVEKVQCCFPRIMSRRVERLFVASALEQGSRRIGSETFQFDNKIGSGTFFFGYEKSCRMFGE